MKATIRHYVTTNMPYKLLSFLIENAALEEYIDNTINQGYSLVEKYPNYCKVLWENMEMILRGSFQWAATPEGYYYWYDLNKKWVEQWTKKKN